MRSLIVIFSVISAVFAGEAQFFPAGFQNSGDVASVNAAVMERLRQEAGSERGLYHVYLPDGRLQRVEYTAAPVTQQKSADFKSAPSSYVGQTSSNLGNAFYVEVPFERLQALRASQQTFQQQNYQQEQSANYKGTSQSPAPSAFYAEIPSDRFPALLAQQRAARVPFQQQYQSDQKAADNSHPLVVDAQLAPLEVVTVEQLAQLRSHQ